ncbi:MAG TPA: hypothetical protein VGN01_09260 [Acidobacteriaceae bacterium]|jgi:hypothetical protein
MKLRSIALALVPALSIALATAAHAQAGVYVTFDAQQFTQDGIYANPGIHGNVDRPWLFGPTFGVYYDVTHLPRLGALKTGPFLVGIDGRGDVLRVSEYGSQLDRTDGLFSIRVATKKKLMNTSPYIQGGFGIGHTRVPFAAHYSNNFIYQFSLGVDRKIHGNFDWRVVEASAGSLANYTTGGGSHPSNYMITLSTGVVYRLR